VPAFDAQSLVGSPTPLGVLLQAGGSIVFLLALATITLSQTTHWFAWLVLLPVALLAILATIDQCVLHVELARDTLLVRRAWGTRTMPLQDIVQVRFMNGEYRIASRDNRFVLMPYFISNRIEILDRLELARAQNALIDLRANQTTNQPTSLRSSEPRTPNTTA
jgi:hypothetical protein